MSTTTLINDKSLNDSCIGPPCNWYPDALAPCGITTFFGFWLFINWSVGLFLNGSIIYVFIKNKELRSPTNAFIISINIGDILACIFEMPLPMIANFSCKWIWGKTLCFYEGFIEYCVGVASMYVLSLVSIDRWIAIAHPLEHNKITYKVQIGCVLFCYLQGFLWAGFPLFGWSSYAMEGALTTCSVQWQDKSFSVWTYNISMFFFVLVVPVTAMAITNWKLYMTIRHIARHGAWDMNDPKTKKKLEVEKRIAKTAVMMIVVFLLAWSPYAYVAFVSAFGDPHSITPWMATMPALIAKSQVIWNPMVYVATNKNFRQKLPFFKTAVNAEAAEQSQSQSSVVHKPKVEEIRLDEVSAGGATAVSQVN